MLRVLHTLGRSLGHSTCSTSARTFVSIPVIDIHPLVDLDSAHADRQKVASQLHDACKNVGFFYVRNHGVPEELCQDVLKAARRWFSLPAEVKRQIAISPKTHYRGYQTLGDNVTRYGESFQRDWHEAIDLYYEVDASNAKGLRQSAIHGHNQWPEQDPEFNSILKQYIRAMSTTGEQVMGGIALGLGLPRSFFDDANRGGDPYWVTRVIHYPPLVQDQSGGADAAGTGHGSISAAQQALAGAEVPRSTQLSCGEHTDYGLLTLVNQEATLGALQSNMQVKNAEGAWITAEPIPGTFVCNIGDMMQVWTNGLYTPTLHRVINPHPTKSRVSIPFFFEPGFDTLVQPVAGLAGSQPGLEMLAPVNYGKHLERKVYSNFEL